MMRLQFRYLVILTASVLIATGCTSLKEPELVSVEIVDLSRTAGDGTLQVNLTYSNPNGKQLTIKRVDVDGRINQKSLGKFTLPKRGRIEKKAEEVIEVKYDFVPDNIYKGFLSKQFGAIGSKSVRITLTGEAEFLKEEESMIIPLEYSEIYEIPK